MMVLHHAASPAALPLTGMLEGGKFRVCGKFCAMAPELRTSASGRSKLKLKRLRGTVLVNSDHEAPSRTETRTSKKRLYLSAWNSEQVSRAVHLNY